MNVLTPVTMYLDAAWRRCSTREVRKALASAQSRLAELRRLGEELKDYYREPELSPTAIRLADVVASCLGDLRASAGGGWSPPELEGLDLFRWLGDRDARGFEELSQLVGQDHPLVGLPLLDGEPSDVESLRRLGSEFENRLQQSVKTRQAVS